MLSCLRTVGLTLLVAASLASAAADDSCIAARDKAAVENFFKKLQTAVAADDRNHVARMVSFPIKISSGGKKITLRNRAELLKYYDAAFDSNVKNAIAKQQFHELFCNWRGIMIGDGEIWFEGVGSPATLKIIAINNNPPSSASETATTPKP